MFSGILVKSSTRIISVGNYNSKVRAKLRTHELPMGEKFFAARSENSCAVKYVGSIAFARGTSCCAVGHVLFGDSYHSCWYLRHLWWLCHSWYLLRRECETRTLHDHHTHCWNIHSVRESLDVVCSCQTDWSTQIRFVWNIQNAGSDDCPERSVRGSRRYLENSAELCYFNVLSTRTAVFQCSSIAWSWSFDIFQFRLKKSSAPMMKRDMRHSSRRLSSARHRSSLNGNASDGATECWIPTTCPLLVWPLTTDRTDSWIDTIQISFAMVQVNDRVG